MSWRFGALLLRHDFTDEIDLLWSRLNLTRSPTGRHLSLSDATSSRFHDTAVGVLRGVTLVHDNMLPYGCSFEDDSMWGFDDRLAEASRHCDVLAVLLDGTSGTYGFSLFSEGARVRRYSVVPGAGRFDEGDELPGEEGRSDDETRIFAVFSAFLGTSFVDALQDKSLTLAVYARPEDD